MESRLSYGSTDYGSITMVQVYVPGCRFDADAEPSPFAPVVPLATVPPPVGALFVACRRAPALFEDVNVSPSEVQNPGPCLGPAGLPAA
jgi:hypothetical protein